MIKLNENIYGHKSRLDWIIGKIEKDDIGIEFGCGTGVMITSQLHYLGYNISGIDLDEGSIDLGKSIFKENALDSTILNCTDLKDLPNESLDYIIASEVLEHIPSEMLSEVFVLLNSKLKENGKLLVTIPNGYGCFEIEDFIWSKMKIGSLLKYIKINSIIRKFKSLFIGGYTDCIYPSSIADSPHLQRFTVSKFSLLAEKHNFSINDFSGSSILAGPFSNMFFTGFKFIMSLNIKLARIFPGIASGFYFELRRKN